MKKFEIGHTYFDRYACDYETLSVIKIVKRTAKTVVFERNGETRRALLREDSNGEYIIPDHYSMACVYRADSEIVDGVPNDELDVYETAEAEEAPESLENAPVEAEKPEVGKVYLLPGSGPQTARGHGLRRGRRSCPLYRQADDGRFVRGLRPPGERAGLSGGSYPAGGRRRQVTAPGHCLPYRRGLRKGPRRRGRRVESPLRRPYLGLIQRKNKERSASRFWGVGPFSLGQNKGLCVP